MNQSERLVILLDYFLSEKKEYSHISLPPDYTSKRRYLRSLINVRLPGPVPSEILSIQDEFLKEEASEKGIVSASSIPFSSGKLAIWQGDITRLAVDAIVNAANSALLGCFVPCHGCIDNAIHTAAGLELREECNRIMEEKRKEEGPYYEEGNGRAVLTGGFNLPAKYIIHTVGPIVRGKVSSENRRDLANCYRSILECAADNSIRTLAFCCISTGEFHYPNEEAARIAVEEVSSFLSLHPDSFDKIIFNVFKDEDLLIYRRILKGETE